MTVLWQSISYGLGCPYVSPGTKEQNSVQMLSLSTGTYGHNKIELYGNTSLHTRIRFHTPKATRYTRLTGRYVCARLAASWSSVLKLNCVRCQFTWHLPSSPHLAALKSDTRAFQYGTLSNFLFCYSTLLHVSVFIPIFSRFYSFFFCSIFYFYFEDTSNDSML